MDQTGHAPRPRRAYPATGHPKKGRCCSELLGCGALGPPLRQRIAPPAQLLHQDALRLRIGRHDAKIRS